MIKSVFLFRRRLKLLPKVLIAIFLGGAVGFFMPDIVSFSSNYINQAPKIVIGDIRGYAQITDGDTIIINGERIRFHGIDAPEIDQSCWIEDRRYQCGMEAKAYLNTIINNQLVNCITKNTDRYGRTIASCYNYLNEDIEALMVSAGMAVAYTYYSYDYIIEETVVRATEAADKAISLKPNLSQGWSIKGFIHSNNFEFIEAEEALRRATMLNPNNETGWLWLNLHYSAVGRHDLAQQAVERAIEIEPSSAIVHNVLGTVLQSKGEREQAFELQKLAVDEMGFRLGLIDQAMLAIEANDQELAIAKITRFFANSDEATKERLNLYIRAYFDLSLRAEASSILQAQSGEEVFFGAALLQDGDKMAEYFKGTTVNKVFNFRRIYYETARPIFNQANFKDYVKEIGLLAYWEQYQFPDFCRAIGENDLECT